VTPGVLSLVDISAVPCIHVSRCCVPRDWWSVVVNGAMCKSLVPVGIDALAVNSAVEEDGWQNVVVIYS
jgi:hypothetical protein